MADETSAKIALKRIRRAARNDEIELDLSGLNLRVLPTEIGKLINLKRLFLGKTERGERAALRMVGNNIKVLPPEIGQLRNLEVLDVTANKIRRLPSEIGNLKNLKTLSFSGETGISGNPLEYLPSEIGNLRNLVRLDLANGLLSSIPEEIGQLSKLQILNLHKNKISALPKELGKLEELRELFLGSNELATIPPEIGNLSKLEILMLFRNKLVKLPSLIGNFKKLKQLNVEDNLLSEIPNELSSLTNLKILKLQNNFLPIPPEILDKSDDPKAVLNYYFSVIEQKRKSINEIKLLVVGQGSVGKTSLVQQILHGTFDQGQTKTEGISINRWTVDGGPKSVESSSIVDGPSSIKLNIWDFGGQEIMHATHQFFLTKRSLYLLVLDARLTQEENRVEYWLKIIQSFGGESPVLIVGNKTDQHPLDIDRTGLQKKYPNIVGILETSASTGAGIETLKAEIAKHVEILPHVRDLLPEAWFTVKSKLEELGRDKNFITQDEYLGLCDINSVTDETSQDTLIGFLHDLGVVLHFQDDPRLEALGILNPQWVTNGVYKILNAKALFKNKGVLTRLMLDNILKTQAYPSNKRMFIVDMMKKFELCYDLEKDTTFLVPDLLPKDEPRELDFKGIPAFQYDYPVLPSSIITRLIVRMNQNIYERIVWRTGVLLKIGKNFALVKADIEDKKITIDIDGVEYTRRDVLSAIRFQLDEIHDTIKGLDPQKRVPIPDAPNAEPLDYEYLLQLERDGDLEILPVKDGNRLVKVNIRRLLSGVESEDQRKQSSASITNIYVAGDVSGSNVIVGNENTASIINKSFNRIYRKIEKSSRIDSEKRKLTTQVKQIEQEVAKGDQANESFLSRRLRTLKKMAPDIADISLSALIGPSAAVSTIVKKVAMKIKEETGK